MNQYHGVSLSRKINKHVFTILGSWSLYNTKVNVIAQDSSGDVNARKHVHFVT